MKVFLIRDREDDILEGIFWAHSEAELHDLINQTDDPSFYQFSEITTAAGLMSVSDADPDAMLHLPPIQEAGATLSEYEPMPHLLNLLRVQALDWRSIPPPARGT